MKRMVTYFLLGLIAQFVFLSFIPTTIEDGLPMIRDLTLTTVAFLVGSYGHDTFVKHPLIVFIFPFGPVLLWLLGL